jgi:DNA-binding CsgD family transcriptional regulator
MMMDQTEQLSEVISAIYDAVLDRSLWNGVLGKVARFVGGSAAILFSTSADAGNATVFYDSGTDPQYRQLDFDEYVHCGRHNVARLFLDIGQPVAAVDLMPYGEFLKTRFYGEWARPQGLIDFIGVALDKSANGDALLGVFRHQRDGLVDDRTRERMRLIAPHIRRAVLASRLFEVKAAEAAAFADTLDSLHAGICFVESDGRIVHSNDACKVILASGDCLSVIRGRVVASDPVIDKHLRELFAAAGGDSAIDGTGVSLPLIAQDGARYIAHVLPLTSGTRRPIGIARGATAALVIRRAALEIMSSPEIIARSYNLTPTELRVLLALVEVGGVPEVAASLGVAETTVKTHLGRLFAKTDAGRQADLVKIVAGFATPLAGKFVSQPYIEKQTA